MLTDRRRVEAGIIPALIFGVVHGLGDMQQTAEEKASHALIVAAALEATIDPVRDLLLGRAEQILRRTNREYKRLAAILEGTSNAQAMMATYYLLEGLLQEERLSIYADSEFAKALEAYMAAIDKFFESEKLDVASQKRARQLRDELRTLGYFK